MGAVTDRLDSFSSDPVEGDGWQVLAPLPHTPDYMQAGVHGIGCGGAMIRFPYDTLRYLTVRKPARVQCYRASPRRDRGSDSCPANLTFGLAVGRRPPSRISSRRAVVRR